MVKVLIKKNIKPRKKIMKQKQSQKQTVNINIGDTITKKKRGRPTKRAQPVKPTQQPIIQSFNQPIFKQSTPQPSNLSSAILATQDKQNTQTGEPVSKANDLERVKTERITKLDTVKEIKTEQPIRNALLGQLLSEQQDDTEELISLSIKPKPPIILFNPLELTPISTVRKRQPPTNPLINFSSEPVEQTPLTKQIQTTDLLSTLNDTSQRPLIEEEAFAVEEETNENALTKQQQESPSTILEEEEKPPTLIQSVRQADQYTTEQLVKGEEPSNELPTAQAELVSIIPSKQIENKWRELHKEGGPLESSKDGYRRKSSILLNEINTFEPTWFPTPTGKKSGPVAKERSEPIITETSKKKRGRPSRNDLVKEV